MEAHGGTMDLMTVIDRVQANLKHIFSRQASELK